MDGYFFKVIWIGDFYLGPWQIPTTINLTDEYARWILSEYKEKENPENDPVRFAVHLARIGCKHIANDVEWWGGRQPRHDRPHPQPELPDLRSKDDLDLEIPKRLRDLPLADM